MINNYLSISFILISLTSCNSSDNSDESDIAATRITVPVIEENGYPVVRAEIDNILGKMLIDTGASHTVISSTLLEKQDNTWIIVPSICLGDGKMCFKNVLVLAWDTPFSQADENEINGLIGMNILQGLVLELNHLKEVTLDIAGDVCSSGESYPMEYDDHGRPHIDITIDNHYTQKVLLDTGGQYITLGTNALEKMDDYVKNNAREIPGCTVNGCQEGGFFCINSERILCS
jgi:predicted aspartyl protease